MKTTAWGLGAAAAIMLAAPASSLTLEEFFNLPPSFVAQAEGEVFFDPAFDEVQAFAFAPGDLEIFLAAFGGLGGGTGASLFGPNDFDALVFGQSVTGEFAGFDVAADDSFIRVLFETTLDEGNQAGDYLGLMIDFDLNYSFDDLLDGGFALASLRLHTGSAPRDPDGPVIPLPAPLALLGLGIAALGAAGWRRRPAA